MRLRVCIHGSKGWIDGGEFAFRTRRTHGTKGLINVEEVAFYESNRVDIW